MHEGFNMLIQFNKSSDSFFSTEILDMYMKDDAFWKMLVFTDESRFCAQPDGGVKLWRKGNDF